MAESKSAEKSAKKKAPQAAAEAPARGACTADKCKQPLRAKGYCRKHYQAWRRGKLGAHHRYKTCSKEGCRKARVAGGLCDEHQKKKGGEAAA